MSEKLREAAQQALEALASYSVGERPDAVGVNDLIARLEAALAEPDIDSVDEYRKGFIHGHIDMLALLFVAALATVLWDGGGVLK